MTVLPSAIEELIEFVPGTLRVSSREGKHREFKQQFDKAEFPRYAKILAAFSNTDGGILVFGIAERPRRIVGVDVTQIPDEAAWTDTLKKDFDPEIPFDIKEYSINQHMLVAVAVDRNLNRPVICKRNASVRVDRNGRPRDEMVIQEGTIYYRQSGQTRPISFSELRALLEEQEEQRVRAFLANVDIMQKIGPERVGLFDASKTTPSNQTAPLYLSPETAKSLNFIDKGRLVRDERHGAPAYFVAGTVQLNQVMVRPMEEADKNLPGEAAEKLRPVIRELYGDDVLFTAQHLAKLANRIGIRTGTETDPRYCVQEKKLNRVFYTRAGIEYVASKLRADPDDLLRSFAARATIAAHEARTQHT